MDNIEIIDDKTILAQYISDFEHTRPRSHAVKILDAIVSSNPGRAWCIIKQVIDSTSNASLMAYIAASQIEYLLVYHPNILEIIEIDAKDNIKICEALDCVWKNKMTEETWDKLQLIIDKYYRDDIIKMQQLLIEAGYNLSDEYGITGPKTRQAIRELRKKTGLPLESVEEVIDELGK